MASESYEWSNSFKNTKILVCDESTNNQLTAKPTLRCLSNAFVKQEPVNNQLSLALSRDNLGSHPLKCNSSSAVGAHQSQYFCKKIITIKEEPTDDCPPVSDVARVNRVAGLMDNYSSNFVNQSNDTSQPLIKTGTCFLSGDALCGTNGVTCASDDEDEEGSSEHEKDFLPPPPMSSSEVDQ